LQQNIEVIGSEEDDSHLDGIDLPCIIFLDSLKAHQKSAVANNVRKWLNHEWKRMGKGTSDVFTPHSFKVYDPKGT